MKITKSKEIRYSFNEMSDEKLENLLKKKGGKKIKVILTIITIVVLPLWPAIPILTIVGYFVFFGVIKNTLEHRRFMRNYANANNLEFINFINKETLKGRLFSIGHSQLANNAITGKYIDNSIRIFNYSYTVGSGKNSRTSRFTVCEVEIEKTQFPHIFLKSDSMWRHSKKDAFGQDKDVRIKLNKEFEDKFELYATQDYEIEVLQIFTPELLKILTDQGSHFSIEFAENKIYFYDDLVIKKHSQLENLYSVVKKVLDSSGPLLHRLHDDFDAMHQSYRK
jgi:hypothetical protein